MTAPGASSRPAPATTRQRSQTTEYFAPVLGIVDLPGNGQEFLDAAVAHANDRLVGTLGANVLIDPSTQTALGAGFENAIGRPALRHDLDQLVDRLRIPHPDPPVGRLPRRVPRERRERHRRRAQRAAARRCRTLRDPRPFRPFPRSIPRIIRTMSLSRDRCCPKPPWFVDSRTGATVSEGFTRYRMDGNLARMAGTLVQAFRA